MFVEKAADLGNRLLHAFETPSGIPYGSVSLNGRGGSGHNAAWTGNSAVLSELGTLQVGPCFVIREICTCPLVVPTCYDAAWNIFEHTTV